MKRSVEPYLHKENKNQNFKMKHGKNMFLILGSNRTFETIFAEKFQLVDKQLAKKQKNSIYLVFLTTFVHT